MNTSCPHCGTTFRVDPARVPLGGVRARCSVCRGVFPVTTGAPPAAASAAVPVSVPPQPAAAAFAAPAAPAPPARPSTPAFGSSDPQAKARRLARALVSDMATYHPERRDRGLHEGTLKQQFREEIRKSWQEYVEQVGTEIAQGTTHFRDALNDILARGQKVF